MGEGREPSPELSASEIARRLRAHLALHNLRVIALAVLTCAAAIVLWAVLYVIGAWLAVLVLTVAEADPAGVMRAYPVVFGVAALCLVAVAWLDRRLTPNERPVDEKPPDEIAMDFILAIPRTTLAVWSTLTAWQHLSAAEVREAAAFLVRLARERRIPVHSVPLDIPRENARWRILFALQLVQIIDLRRDEREGVIVLNALRPESLRLGK
jgi:hypothetical protein